MSKARPFIIGGVVGAAIALLYAPYSGADTRALVADKMNGVWGEARDFGAQATSNAQCACQAAQERGSSIAQDVTGTAQSFAKAATAQVGDFAQQAQMRGEDLYQAAAARRQGVQPVEAPSVVDADEELREKIEAARKRIAEQVVANTDAAVQVEPVACEQQVIEEQKPENPAEIAE